MSCVPVRIDNILVEVGDYVKKGQTLVYMDKTKLVQSKLQLENQGEYNRINELFKIGGVSESGGKLQNAWKFKNHPTIVLENTTLLSLISEL